MSDSVRDGHGAIHAPHPPLVDYYDGEQERAGWLRHMFDRTAPDYDRIETIVGLGSGSWYRREALLRAGLRAGMRELDVAVGTGLVARQAAAIVGDPKLVTGMDPSPGMLQSAKVPAGVALIEGRAESIPFPDANFDFLSMGYALRHISALPSAFSEFFRVLKPGGRLCILEITCPQSRIGSALLKAYLRGVVPALARLTAKRQGTPELWRYYWDTIEACVRPEQVVRILESVGFANVTHSRQLGIFSEYVASKPA